MKGNRGVPLLLKLLCGPYSIGPELLNLHLDPFPLLLAPVFFTFLVMVPIKI